MYRRIRRKIGAALLAVALAACGASRPEITLQPITFEKWQQHLASLKGRIVVVDVWATWCAPCIERFPRMVELYKQYHDRGVTFISLSVDNRDDKQAVEDARRFLVRQNAVFQNFLLDENILEAFEKLDILGIPAVFVYDRAGERRYKLTGDDPNRQFTERDVEAAVAALLAG